MRRRASASRTPGARGGILRIDHIGVAPRDPPSRVLDRDLGEGNSHPIEYQIFFMNIPRNARIRVDASVAGR